MKEMGLLKKLRVMRRTQLALWYMIGLVIGMVVGSILLNTHLFGWILEQGIQARDSAFRMQLLPDGAMYAPDPDPKRDTGTLYAGVLSSWPTLRTRALSVDKTWARQLPEGNPVEYFVGHTLNGGNTSFLHFPVIAFEGVEDKQYPPQKKAFQMLKHMCTHHLSKYDWFLRSDDDMYLKVAPLLEFLKFLNPENLVYMGQIGYGRTNDTHRLQLANGTYCLGGPGVIFSRAALQQLCPHIQSCELESPTLEEDVEIGRCVQKHLNIHCTSSKKLAKLFYHPYKDVNNNREPYTGNLESDPDVLQALTLHHAKSAAAMFNLHLQYLREQLNGHKQNLFPLSKEVPQIPNHT